MQDAPEVKVIELSTEEVLKEKIVELGKLIVIKDSTIKYYSDEVSSLRNEIEQLNLFLDTLPGIIERLTEGEPDNEGVVKSWTIIKRSALIRLSSWLACRK